jgi:hypothetical protein
MDERVFKRFEYKYRMTEAQYAGLMAEIGPRLAPDVYGESLVCSVYYDTPDHRLIRRSLEKPTYKEKLRLRSYGRAEAGSDVFLEMKKKYEGVVYKRRIVLPQQQAAAYMRGEQPLPADLAQSQIGRELDYFCRFYGDLQPAVYLCYDRTAFCCPQSPELRVTFDRNVRWRTEALSLEAEPGGERLLPEDTVLLEVKTATAIPLWLVQALDAQGIRRSSFSKYGTVYRQHLGPGRQKEPTASDALRA